jgi:predicted CoA-substrate-specific enzyme activase
MITGGIDVGIETLKAVILKDGQIVARGIAFSGGGHRAKSVEQVWNETLQAARLSSPDIERVVATGQGKKDVHFATSCVVEPVADARVARFLYPKATSVVDIGADQTRVVTLGDGGSIQEVVLNQKCSAGLGIFLKFMARKLDMTLDEMSRISLSDNFDIVVNDGCAVFAELDALSLLNRNLAREDVARAIIEAVAVKVNSILNDKLKPLPNTTLMIGGVSRNTALVKVLQKRSGINFLVPDRSDIAGALGAALIAMDYKQGG